MDFEKRKAATLTSLRSEVTGKFPEGTVDTSIIPLLDVINHHRDYFTTSSCSGRISILSQPTRNRVSKKKASGGAWLYISHDPVDSDSVLDLVFRRSEQELRDDQDDVVFRFSPLIFTVECRDVAAAQVLVSPWEWQTRNSRPTGRGLTPFWRLCRLRVEDLWRLLRRVEITRMTFPDTLPC